MGTFVICRPSSYSHLLPPPGALTRLNLPVLFEAHGSKNNNLLSCHLQTKALVKKSTRGEEEGARGKRIKEKNDPFGDVDMCVWRSRPGACRLCRPSRCWNACPGPPGPAVAHHGAEELLEAVHYSPGSGRRGRQGPAGPQAARFCGCQRAVLRSSRAARCLASPFHEDVRLWGVPGEPGPERGECLCPR